MEGGSKYNYYKVCFLNTGNIDEYRKDAIRNGEIRDKYAKTLLGVGIIGNVKTRGKNKTLYTTWRNMIVRCYDENYLGASSYYRRVTVCERWLVFENFLSDVCLIDGWDSAAFDNNLLVLDKDKKQRFFEKKVYSVDTCSWLSREENNKYQDFQQRRFKAISPNGDIYIDYNITNFARENGLSRRQVSATLHNRFKSTQGWKFKFIDNDIV